MDPAARGRLQGTGGPAWESRPVPRKARGRVDAGFRPCPRRSSPELSASSRGWTPGLTRRMARLPHGRLPPVRATETECAQSRCLLPPPQWGAAPSHCHLTPPFTSRSSWMQDTRRPSPVSAWRTLLAFHKGRWPCTHPAVALPLESLQTPPAFTRPSCLCWARALTFLLCSAFPLELSHPTGGAGLL